MRNFTLILLTLFVTTFSATPTQAQYDRSAVDYMEKMFTSLNSSKEETWQYLKAVTRGKGAKKIESKRQALLTQLKTTKIEIQKMGNYEDNDSLKNAAVIYLDLSYSVLKEDYDKILNMEEIMEQSYDLMEAYILAQEKASDKLNASFEELVAAQRKFASANNITLLEGDKDETTQKIELASNTLKHYHEVYLIFFKAYKQEAYTLDAMQRNDINGIEQNAASLVLNAQEGLDKLALLKGFNGDDNLIKTCQMMMNFYKKEGETDFPAMTEFNIKKDNFDKIQKAFEAIPAKKRTQQDVDQYNNGVNEINAAVTKTNKLNDELNKARKIALDKWNKAVEEYFERHNK
jgi:hypothetical protein